MKKLPKFKIKIQRLDIIIWLLLFMIGFNIMSEIETVEYRLHYYQSEIIQGKINIIFLEFLEKLAE